MSSRKIFHILVGKVAPLIDEEKEAGSYEVTWDAGGLPSGVYILSTAGEGCFYGLSPKVCGGEEVDLFEVEKASCNNFLEISLQRRCRDDSPIVFLDLSFVCGLLRTGWT
ncbi:MAG: hypothetical protein ACE5H0_02340 [Bacteroidota bacterium]